MSMKEISKYLHEEWRRGDPYFQGETWEAEVSVVYDHDYQFHIVLLIHPKDGESFHAMFFIGTVYSCLVKRWNTSFPQGLWAEASEVVQVWADMCAEESRSF